MNENELRSRLALGEDSHTQFKAAMPNAESLAAELVAFSNGSGGTLFVGAGDDGSVVGLGTDELRRLNLLISNAASQGVRPAVNPISENIATASGTVVAITVLEGASKPYMDKEGIIWVKSGADKHRATSREKIQRMFQNSGLIHGDEIPVRGMTASDIDLNSFGAFYENVYGGVLDTNPENLARLLRNMNLATEEWLNVAGALLFSKLPSSRLPVYTVKAVSYPGPDIDTERYDDSQDILGSIQDQFRGGISFILRALRHLQGEKSINSEGDPEVPRIVFEELIANALIHRDYFISAPIRIFVFADHIEIISPGIYPTISPSRISRTATPTYATRYWQAMQPRYCRIADSAAELTRVLKAWSRTDFIDDRDGNLFKAIVRRP